MAHNSSWSNLVPIIQWIDCGGMEWRAADRLAKAYDQKNATFDPQHPASIVGARIHIGRETGVIVSAYDSGSGLHTLV
jgi:hypothetical protein